MMTLTFALLASCGKQEEEYLYDKYDGSDWNAVLALKKKECETKNKIFAKLDETSTFSNFFTKKDVRIFKIERKISETVNGITAESEKTDYIYIVLKKETLSNGVMDVVVTGTGQGFVNKRIVYEQKNNKTILNTAKVGACSDKYKKAIGTDFLTIVSERKKTTSTEPEVYKEYSESLDFFIGLPAIVSHWNGTVTRTDKNEYNKTTTVWDAKSGAVEITTSQCTDTACKNALGTGSSIPQICALEINETHYDSTLPEERLTSFPTCN